MVGEIGRDTKTGILGRGYSYDNGATFHVTDTMFGRLYDKDDGERMWPNMAHKVADEIKSATADLPNVRKQADEAVKFAESAIAASKVNSDAIVAQSSAVVEAKSAMDSATAEIQQLKANGASDVAQIKATIAEVQAGVNQAKSANESAVQAVQAELKSTSDAMDKVKKQLDEVGTSLDTYAKSAAEQGHDITLIKQKQGRFEADFASAQGNVNQVQVDIKGLRQNIKDNQGNIASLLASADKLQASMTDAEKNITNLLLTASKYEQTFKDQDGRLSKVEQTATEHTSVLADAKGNIDKVTQKADNLQLLLSDAQKNIQNIQLDAKGLHDTLTGQNNQLASLNVTLNNLDSKYSGITGDLQSKQTALSTEQQQTKDMLLRKADKSEVDNVKGTVNQVSAEQKTMADQINQKVSSTEYQTLKDKVNNLQVGGDNLVSDGDADAYNATPWPNTHFQTHSFYYNGTRKMFNLNTSAKTELTSDGPWFPVIAGHQYTLYFNGFMSGNVLSYDVWLLGKAAGKDGSWTNSFNIINGERLSPARNCIVTRTFTVPNDWNNFVAHLRFDNNGSTDGQDSVFFFNEVSLKEGNINTGYSPSPDDAIASIKKNSTAIDENSKLISLMAKQTEVDNVKNTAQQISSRLDVLAGEVKSKVDETKVNNIVDGKGYATTSTVQSLVDQKAGTINESITNLEGKFNSSSSVNLAEKTNQGTTNWSVSPGNGSTTISEVNINGVRGVRFTQTRKSTSWWVIAYQLNLDYFEPNQDYVISFDIRTSSDNFNQGGILNIARGDSSHPYLDNTSFKTNFKQNQLTHVSCTGHSYGSLDKNGETFYLNCVGLGQCDWVDIVNFKIARGTIDKGYSPAPSDNATVTQLQSVTASIDGLQSRVTNYQNDTSSKYTQLSNLMQSKVGTADFNNLKRSVDMQTLDSADINNMKTNGHYFVRNLANNPIGGWVYVDVTGNGNDRIRQDVYQDSGLKHKYRRWFGTYWTGWEEGATYTEITQLQDAVNLRVQKGELLSQINLTAGNTLIQSNKLYLDASSVVFSGRAFIPSAAIAELDADKLTFYGNGSKASIGAGIAQYDQDRVKSTINLQYDGGFEIHSSNNLGSILTMHDDTVRLASKSQVYGAGSGHPLNQQYSGFWASKNYALMNAVDSEGKTTGWTIGSSNSQGYRAYLYDSSTTNQPVNGVGIGTQRFDVYAGNSNIFLGPDKAELRGNDYATVHGNDHTFIEGGNEQIYIHNGEVCIGMPGHENDKTSVHLRVFGWADFNGWMNVMGLSQTSLLSTKTRVAPLDTKVALDKIASADVRTYQFKSDVAQGKTKRHASVIIDDVHDVAEYYTPEEFISENRKGRDDGDIVGYLMGAVQELKKQLDEMKKEVQING
ncbi:tail fiber domain-containing protein [Lactobacillus sp.]|uniref:tail fiber domain-containing protein n=1 Tax=Lactobacillus sp. TaxID=1591 RepID=UPI003F8D66E5